MNKYFQINWSLLFFLCFSIGLTAQEETIEIPTDTTEADDLVPVIVLSESDLADSQDEGVLGLLSASRDLFVSKTDFNLRAARFRLRGYDSDNIQIYFNNVPTNDLESGWAGWSLWGGLNDVTRRQETNTNLEAIGYTFGGVGGALNIDTRASSQRKQIRATITRSNSGNYNNRAMLTWSTGMLQSGWAFAAAASRRWAEEGYIEGTYYDGYSYFLSVDKKLNDKHLINAIFFGAPQKRAKQGASVQEMYDLAGSNYYNPYWGYQNGEKRNSRVADRHQPVAMLRHDWTMNDNTTLSTTVNYQFGKNGSSRLDWYNTPDPRPDYYRRLPSFIEGVDQALVVEQLLKENEELRQLPWDDFYEVNRNNLETIEDANGIQGNAVTGNRSQYIVMDRRYDSKRLNFNTLLTTVVNDDLTMTGGLSYQLFDGENYQLVNDLLGGDYYLDIDKFAERDLVNNPDALQNDLNVPNRVVYEGDRFFYDYESNIRKANAWAQGEYQINSLGVHLSANVSNTNFWRTGNYRNGKFPDSSLGDSEKQSFTNYGLKGGVNYGLDGRNYLFANATYQTRAPYFRDAYVSPRTRDQVIPGLTNVEIRSGEIGYTLQSPNLKAKVAAFYTEFNNDTEIRSFFHDGLQGFVNYIMRDVDKRHQGIEVAFDAKVPFIAGLSLGGAANFGSYIYNSRPNALVSQDNNAELLVEDRTVYIQNFLVPGTPQTAGTLGLEYQTANYLTANVNFNYFDDIWLDFNPDRRTEASIYDRETDIASAVEQGSDLWKDIIYQEKVPSAYTLDVSLRKSFKISDDYYINVMLNINNILNNQNFITGGYEQLRYDYEGRDVDRFPTKYFYGRGITYFFNVAFSYRP